MSKAPTHMPMMKTQATKMNNGVLPMSMPLPSRLIPLWDSLAHLELERLTLAHL